MGRKISTGRWQTANKSGVEWKGKSNAKTGLENKQGRKTLINKLRKKTTVCIVYNNLEME